MPDVPRLLQLVDKDMTHQQIADMFGVSRQAVTLKLKGATAPRMFRRDWPWDVQSRHKSGWLYEAVSFYQAARHKERPLTDRQRQRLSSFLDMLDRLPGDYVVDYYPDTAAGFRLRERRASDDPNSLLGASVDSEQDSPGSELATPGPSR
ncbi:helix-turn-helix domain-containing protein [Pseudonocardia sp. N23]|uniref:helix-turn-helix domain-containing protein n=1 Tax=Pseudonocardia sp. N23 TaxID=1987376 RepID=UPI000BFDEE26|nr:helix-turn-helix domain-containing protein [Pseudonocardia sp. N23]GAY07507.1 hypothetical protein TOK_3527 [Pseudonocardia sp. N23]